MRTQIALTCEQCGQNFSVEPWQARGGAKFCSQKCSGQAQQNRVKCICKVCDKNFQVRASRIKRGRGKFCSRECYKLWWNENVCKCGSESHLWRGGSITQICTVCGNEFETKRSAVRNGRHLCSKGCANQWKSEHQKGADNPSWKGGKIKQICKECDIEFEIWPYEMGRRFCSPPCANANEEVRRKKAAYQWGSNNSNWKDGLSIYPYPPEFNEEFKKNVRERDNCTCAICRLYGNQVHHINYVKDDTTPENCITLCAPCHGVTGGNREYWQNALSQITMARQG